MNDAINPYDAPGAERRLPAVAPSEEAAALDYLALRPVADGLRLIFISLFVWVAANLLPTVAEWLWWAEPKNYVWMVKLLMLTSCGLSLWGLKKCQRSPADLPGKGLLNASITFSLLHLLMAFYRELVPLIFKTIDTSTAAYWLIMFSDSIQMIGVGLFVIFLKKLAKYLRYSKLVGIANSLLVLGILAFACTLVSEFALELLFAVVPANQWTDEASVARLIALLYWWPRKVAAIALLFGLVLYGVLLFALRRRLVRALPSNLEPLFEQAD